MKHLVKVVLMALPLAGLLLWYTVTQQEEHEAELRVKDAQFDRDWYEFEADFADPARRARFEQRAADAEGELQAARGELEAKRARSDRVVGELERGIEDEGEPR